MDIKSLSEITDIIDAEFKKALEEKNIDKMQVLTDVKEKAMDKLELPF